MRKSGVLLNSWGSQLPKSKLPDRCLAAVMTPMEKLAEKVEKPWRSPSSSKHLKSMLSDMMSDVLYDHNYCNHRAKLQKLKIFYFLSNSGILTGILAIFWPFLPGIHTRRQSISPFNASNI